MVRDSIFKACEGEEFRWPMVAPFAFWADHTTTCKLTGYSPFYMVHGVEPTLPFDLTQATFLVPDLTQPLSTNDLLAICACQLQKRPADLAAISHHILTSCHTSAHQFEKQFTNTICNFNFTPGDLILICNMNLGMDKMKPQYTSLMVILWRMHNSAYRLKELDGTISRLCYATF
jgi:hypothetical protein